MTCSGTPASAPVVALVWRASCSAMIGTLAWVQARAQWSVKYFG
jgi:hypothetical protein